MSNIYKDIITDLTNRAHQYAAKYGLTGYDRDAFRHAFTSAALTDKFGSCAAEVLGDAHEMTGTLKGQDPGDRNMDLWNNSVGRSIGRVGGSDEDLAQGVYDAWLSGKLITNPEDSRVYNPLNHLSLLPCLYPFVFPPLALLRVDPLALDLNGDGVKLVGVSGSTAYFDYGSDGFREQTGWISAQDGLLVRDVNRNGKIDDLHELFGSPEQDAFSLLGNYDANADGRINADDAVWQTLSVWQDMNGNGATDPGELKSLSNVGITEFNLMSRPVDVSEGGNLIKAKSTFVIGGQTNETQAVFFGTARNSAIFTPPADFSPSDEVVKLPNMSGGGGAPPLWYAMSINASLLSAVSTLMQDSSRLTPGEFRSAVENVLFKWTGADATNPSQYGGSIDARWVKVLEAFGGSGLPSTNRFVLEQVKTLYSSVLDQFTTRFMIDSYSSLVAINGGESIALGSHPYRFLSSLVVEPTFNSVWADATIFKGGILDDLRRSGLDPIEEIKRGQNNIQLMVALDVFKSVAKPDAASAWQPELPDLPGYDFSGYGNAVAYSLLTALTTGTSFSSFAFGTSSRDQIILTD